MDSSIDDTTIITLLQQFMYQAKRRASLIAEEFGLTAMQAGALLVLKDDEPRAMRELSDYYMCDASTVTGLIDRMEKRGLITRSSHPTDRRITLITLTSEGADMRRQIFAKTEVAEAQRLNHILVRSERAVLQNYLQRIIDNPDN